VTVVSKRRPSALRRVAREDRTAGLALLAAIVALMWLVEVINTIDGNGLDGDGIYARNVDRLWGILTSPFIHASFAHLLDNTIPFVCLGVIIALRGAARLAFITAFVIVVGGLGTWLISPATTTAFGHVHAVDTIGASGVVFGYAAYLVTRGLFDRRLLELLVGAIVALIWGTALVASLVPRQGVSWQAHVCGGAAGVLVAWILSARDRRLRRSPAERPLA
jgi:membrane associated rhomboid family serine protease